MNFINKALSIISRSKKIGTTGFLFFLLCQTSQGQTISRLSYFLPSGGASIGISYLNLSEDVSLKYLGANFVSSKYKSELFKFTGNYGLSETLTLSVGVPLVGTTKSELRYGPASVSNGTTQDLKRSGPANPDMQIRYKALEQDGIKVIIKAGYRPSMTKAKDATATTDGNTAEAQAQMSFGVQYIKSYGDAEFDLSISRDQMSNGSSENASTGVTTDYSGGHSTNLSFMAQKYFNETFFGGGILGYGIGEAGAEESGGSKLDYGTFTRLQLGVAAGAELMQSSVVYFGYLVLQPSSQEISSGSVKLNGEVGQSTKLFFNYSFHF